MIKVGCCGYPVSRNKYWESLSLVELNNTFYSYPRIQTVVKWREEAPKDFEFTVKAHQDISHKSRLRLETALEPFEKMKGICRELRAKILLIQTPASFTPEGLEAAERFFKSISRNGLTIAWETRGPVWEEQKVRQRLKPILEKLDVPHVTDPFKTVPVYTGRKAYFRLHGRGEEMYYYQYSDDELRDLYNLVEPFSREGSEVYVLFNNLSMFDDSKRFLSLVKEGRIPPLREKKGLEAVGDLLSRIVYPSTKSAISKKVGWNLIETVEGRQIRLSELLDDLPSRTYKNVEDLLSELRKRRLSEGLS